MQDTQKLKIWQDMTESETRIAEAMATTGSNDISVIRDSTGYTPQMFNNCKKKMLGKGIIFSKEHGYMEFSLPRFREYVLNIL